MRSVGLLTTRSVLGGYLAVHGAQKLFGSFGGPGLEATVAVSRGWARVPPGRWRCSPARANSPGGC
jgi:putative oxidoreductase